jgi:hypothetical protein
MNQPWIRIVHYCSYSENPMAKQMIADAAHRWIERIFGVCRVNVVEIVPSGRAVAEANDFDLMMVIIFDSEQSCKRYNTEQMHMDFVNFVLRGWMLKGSKALDKQSEFNSHILTGTVKIPYERNKEIPDHEVVWGGKEWVPEGRVIRPREN